MALFLFIVYNKNMKTILKSENKYVLRLDRREELIKSLKSFCIKNKIKGGFFLGIGAASRAEIAYYDFNKKKYFPKKLKGPLEIANLTGNIAVKNKELIIHTHVALGDKEMKTFSGHVNSLIVSPACEILLIKFSKEIKRKYFDDIGLNLMD